MKKTFPLSIAGLVLATLLGVSDVRAVDSIHPLLSDKFTLSAGAFLPDKDVEIRVNGSNLGDNIDFDETWGLSSSQTSGALNFRWRFGEKWSVTGQYFSTSDKGRAVLEEDIHWDDVVFKKGSNVGAGTDLSVARLLFGRTFSTGSKHEFGLGLGLHWLEIGAFVDGEIFVNDETVGIERRSVNAEIPLPNIGGWYNYAFSSKWMVSGHVDWLSASIGDASGGLWNASAGINFQAFRHVGFNLNYQVFSLDIDIDKVDWGGSTEITYSGPFISLNANW